MMKFLLVCPSSHPYSFNNGDNCCSSTYEVDDITIGNNCDGERFTAITSSNSMIDCCLNHVECELDLRPCSDHDPTPQGMSTIVQGFGTKNIIMQLL